MSDDELVEKVAEVICIEFYSTQRPNTSEFRWGICMQLARAALAVARAGIAEELFNDGHFIAADLVRRAGGTP